MPTYLGPMHDTLKSISAAAPVVETAVNSRADDVLIVLNVHKIKGDATF